LRLAAGFYNFFGMTFWVRTRRPSLPQIPAISALSRCHVLTLCLCACALSGCLPGSQSQLDEEKEAHFLEGKSRLNARDYKGSFESFEKALQVNPHSASAHFELALLCDQQKQDYAAAIYHYDRFLDLRPRSDYAEIVRQKIGACKQELARTVSLGPVTQRMQREFEQLSEENKRLHEELEACHANLVGLQQMRANQASVAAAPTRPAPTNNSRQPAIQAQATVQPSNTAVSTPAPARLAATLGRTHTVKPGDTPTMIARKYGVKVDALMAANPSVDARRLQIGQALTLPGQ
jgi:LysM repeat protein